MQCTSKALQMQGGKNVLLGGVELNCAFCVKPRCEFLRRFYNASRLKVLPQARDASNVCRSTKKIRKYISNFSNLGVNILEPVSKRQY